MYIVETKLTRLGDRSDGGITEERSQTSFLEKIELQKNHVIICIVRYL